MTNDRINKIAGVIVSGKYRWKRHLKETGKWKSFGTPADLRGWDLMEGTETIGFLRNVSSSRWSNDESRQWAVHFVAHGRPNISMKKKFDYDHVEAAKKFAEESYDALINSTDENMKSIKESLIKIRESRNLK